MPSDLERARGHYGRWLVDQVLADADLLVAEADRYRQALEDHPEHFQGTWDRESIDILATGIHGLRPWIDRHHDEKDILRFNIDLRGIVQEHRVIEPLSKEARAFLGLQQTATPVGPVDAFRLIGQRCAGLQALLFAKLFEDGQSFADYYFASEYFHRRGSDI